MLPNKLPTILHACVLTVEQTGTEFGHDVTLFLGLRFVTSRRDKMPAS
jgi:hypothetical protein